MTTAVVNQQPLLEQHDALKAFQLSTESISQKSSKEYGKAISKKIHGTITGNMGNYYTERNARFQKNRNYANGRIDVKAMFLDRLRMNGKVNYIALNWQTLQIVNRIISGLVGRWMQRSEKVQVKAIDDLSQTDKQDQYEQIEFILHNRQMIAQLEQQSGVQIVPQDQFIPADKEELNLWQAQFQRLPEEILYETGCNDVLTSNGCFDVLKEKLLHDSSEVGFVGTYTWMDKEGVVHVEWVKPENTIYSFTEYPDFRDTTWRGQMPSRKISEIRKMYGKEFNPDNPNALSEEELWKIAAKSKEYQYNQNLTWDMGWATQYLRPYDEWNVRVLEFELKSVDSDPYTVTKTKSTGSTYTDSGYPSTPSGKKRDKPLENQEVLSDTNWNIYRGVYIPDCDYLVEWKLKDNMIRPQDPREIGNAEFSYSFYMYQPYQMRNLAIPEKIEAAVDGMIFALLKVQQDLATSIPPGWAIDENAMQNIDYGLGDEGNKTVDHTRHFWQTGKLFYKGVDAEGNRIPAPITEMPNTGFAQHIEAFVRTYQFYYQTLKDELGEDPNLISAALQPRVTTGNVDASQQMADFATDYMYRAYAELMKMTARKVSCLLKDSVQYGAKAYRNLIKAEDIGNRIFSTDIRFLPTDVEMQRFDATMQQAMMSTPELVLYIDPFQLMRVAKEDVKMGELLFRQGQKKMLISQQAQATQQSQQNADNQIASAQAAEKAKGENLQFELEMKDAMSDKQLRADKERIVLEMVSSLAKVMATPVAVGKDQRVVDGTITPEIKKLMELAITNIAIPLAIENKMVGEMAQGAQQQPDPNEQQEPQEQNQPPQQGQVAA